MNKYVAIFFCVLFLSTTKEVYAEGDSSVTMSGASYSFIFDWRKSPTESHWTGFGYAISDLRGIEYENVDLNLNKSYSISLNLMDGIYPISHNWLIGTGFGFNWLRYNFGDHVLDKTNNITQFVSAGENETYYNGKLRVCYATIPLFLEYQTRKNDHSFFINGGVEGLIRCGSNSLVEIQPDSGKRYKKKFGKDSNILPVNFRFFAQLGFGDFSFFGYYQPYSIFEKDKGPDVKPVGIGLKLNF